MKDKRVLKLFVLNNISIFLIVFFVQVLFFGALFYIEGLWFEEIFYFAFLVFSILFIFFLVHLSGNHLRGHF